MRIGIVNVNLEYVIPEGVDEEDYLEKVELPKEAVEESFEIVKIIDTEDNNSRKAIDSEEV